MTTRHKRLMKREIARQANRKVYRIAVDGARARFEAWIATRGGVAVWENHEIGGAHSNVYTPAKTESGEPMLSPRWSHFLKEVCTTVTDFIFIKLKEVRRIKVAVKRGSALTFVLTDASERKLNKALSEAGAESAYVFDYVTQEAVIMIPEKEDKANEQPGPVPLLQEADAVTSTKS